MHASDHTAAQEPVGRPGGSQDARPPGAAGPDASLLASSLERVHGLAFERAGARRLCDAAAAASVELLGAAATAVLELMPGGDELVLRGGHGIPERWLGEPVEPSAKGSHAAFVLDAGGPVISAPLAGEERFRPASVLEELGAGAALACPVPGARGPIGVVLVAFEGPDEPPWGAVDAMRAVSAALGAALEHVARRRRHEAQLRVQHIVADARSLTEDGSEVVRALGEELEAGACELWLPANGTGRLHRAASWTAASLDPGPLGGSTAEASPPHPGGELCERAVRARRPVSVSDLRAEGGLPGAREAAGAGLRGCVAFPLLAAGETFGAIAIFAGESLRADPGLTEDLSALGRRLGAFAARKRGEEERRRVQADYDLVLRNLPVGVAMLEPDGSVSYANDAVAEFFGLRGGGPLSAPGPREMIASLDLRDPEGRPVPVDEAAGFAALRGRASSRQTLRCRVPGEDEDRWVVATGVPIPVSDDPPLYRALAVLEEVTDLKRAELAAEESARRKEVVAETLQRGLEPPSHPSIPGVELAVRMLTTDPDAAIGGDFYDVFEAGEGCWAIAIGDVSGKGVEKASVTSLVRWAIRSSAVEDRQPRAVMEALNRTLYRYRPAEEFCTAAYLLLARSGSGVEAKVAVAGHPPPLVMRADGSLEEVSVGGPLLGFEIPAMFWEASLTLGPGDSVVLYTDGVSDAGRGYRGGALGTDRLAELLAANRALGAEGIAAAVGAEVGEREGSAPRDDATVLVLGAGA